MQFVHVLIGAFEKPSQYLSAKRKQLSRFVRPLLSCFQSVINFSDVTVDRLRAGP